MKWKGDGELLKNRPQYCSLGFVTFLPKIQRINHVILITFFFKLSLNPFHHIFTVMSQLTPDQIAKRVCFQVL